MADPMQSTPEAPVDALPISLPFPPPAPERPVISDEHEYPGHCWYRAYILKGVSAPAKGLILEQLKLEVHECPTKTLTGSPYKDTSEGRVRRFGLMRVLHDAQLYLNRTLQV